MVVFGLITSQVACGSKVHQIRTPLDQAQLPKDYTYTVKLKTQEKIRGLQTNDIAQSNNELSVQTPLEKKSIMNQDVEYVYGESNQLLESHRGRSIFTGAIVGTGFGAIAGLFVGLPPLDLYCEDNCPTSSDNNLFDQFKPVFIGAGVGMIIGAGVGALVGSVKEKRKILIIPTVSPSQAGVDAGVNVGVKF